MKRHIIFLATDANRLHIKVGYSPYISLSLVEIREDGKSRLLHMPPSDRIVYMEECRSYEEAQKRKAELSTYTRMMKERLIRRQNPNWLNIVRGTTAGNNMGNFGLAHA